jgi:hypothetical protein
MPRHCAGDGQQAREIGCRERLARNRKATRPHHHWPTPDRATPAPTTTPSLIPRKRRTPDGDMMLRRSPSSSTSEESSPAGSGFRRHPCRCLWRGSAHTTKTTPRRRTILHLSQMRRTLARTFILAIVATVAHAFNGNRETDGKPSTIETHPPDPQGGGEETGRNDTKLGFRS